MQKYTLTDSDISLKTFIRMKARMRRTWFGKLEIEDWINELYEKKGRRYGIEGGLRRTRELREDGYLVQKERRSVNKINYALYRYLF